MLSAGLLVGAETEGLPAIARDSAGFPGIEAQQRQLMERRAAEIAPILVLGQGRSGSGGGLYDLADGRLRPRFTATAGLVLGADRDAASGRVLIAWQELAGVGDAHIYLLDPAGPRALTRGAGWRDTDPLWLPDGGILLCSTRSVAVDARGMAAPALFTCDGEGRFLRRLGSDPGGAGPATLLEDGRVVYERLEAIDRGRGWKRSLMAMNPDGTGLTGFGGNDLATPRHLAQARAMPGGARVLAVAGNGHDWMAGDLVEVDGSKPGEVVPVAPRRAASTLADPTFANGELQFRQPLPLGDDLALASVRRDDGPWGLALVDLQGGGILLLAAHVDLDLSAVDSAQPRRPAHRRPVISDPRRRNGWLYIEDVRQGAGLAGAARDEVRALRVVQVEAPPAATLRIAPGQPWPLRTVLGTLPVAEDGSVFASVPAETALLLQALDASGRVVQTMRSSFTVQRGERMSCLGCHESRTQAPGLRTPLAFSRPAVEIRKVDALVADAAMAPVRAALKSQCMTCHAGALPIPIPLATGVGGTAPWGAQAGPRPLRGGGAVGSPLLALIDQGHQGMKTPADERAQLAFWADLGYPCLDLPDEPAWRAALERRKAWQDEERRNRQDLLLTRFGGTEP